MPLSNDEQEEVRKVLEQLTEDGLEAVHRSAQRLLADLEDTNSAFRATRIFLHERGFTNVRQLDAETKKALLAHLKNTLRLATH